MTGYAFSVNGLTDAGALTWNPNGTLAKLVISDQLNASDSQTCNYLYDDLQRISTANCGALWTQNFTYDAFGNITKSVPQGSNGLTFAPVYTAANQFYSIPGVSVQYDANGNLLTDNLNTYAWDAFGQMISVNTGAATVNVTYDALGRMIENNVGGAYSQFLYAPTGAKLAKMSGQTLIKGFISLPGGGKAIYNSSGLAYFRHSDWLGTSRLTSTAAKPTQVYSSMAYAPFGEQYATMGTNDASFTGQDQDTVSSLYDFPARRMSSSQGRWISPDPAGRGAVSLTNPQSWNRYAYVNNNPLRLIDSLGMDPDCNADPFGDFTDAYTYNPCFPGGGGGGGTGDSGDDNSGSGNNCDADCQLQQQQEAEQNAQNALNDPDCAQAVDGGTGAASSTIAGTPGASMGTITPGPLGTSFATGNIALQATPSLPDYTSLYASQTDITLNSDANGFFINYLPGGGMTFTQIPGYGPIASQTILLLHDIGHQAYNNFLPTVVTPDGVGYTGGDANQAMALSLDNSANVGAACMPQGDFGGNQGPVDNGGGDVPAIAKPVRRLP